MREAISALSFIFITYYLTFKYMWIKELKYWSYLLEKDAYLSSV